MCEGLRDFSGEYPYIIGKIGYMFEVVISLNKLLMFTEMLL